MKKILLVGAASLRVSPYINNYINILEKNNISYDFVYWNRDMEDTECSKGNHYAYNNPIKNKGSKWKKAFGAVKFSWFVKEHLKNHQYERIVVFTIVSSLLLQSFLKKKYSGRYIVDIRDYSSVCKVVYFNTKLNELIRYSLNVVVSSAGFLKWLPIKGLENKIVVAHNISFDKIGNFNDVDVDDYDKMNHLPIHVLTIGQIRDFSANATLIRKLSNHPNFYLSFSGVGPANDSLQMLVKDLKVLNVSFTGKYEKAEEDFLVRNCDMINIFFNHSINSDTLMSNRFYLSVLHRKPMIVASQTYQAELVSEYNLGVVLESQDDFCSKIQNYWRLFDKEKYDRGCRSFLKRVENDMNNFRGVVFSNCMSC